MRKINSILLLCVLLSAFLHSCDDIVEEDLTKEVLLLKNPNDSLITTFATQTFMWHGVDGADAYHIQIVNGTFSQINFFVLDSNIAGTQFVYNLSPGPYQWRVAGFNSVSRTPYTTRSIRIDSTSELFGQSVLLRSPANNKAVNDTSLGFNWEHLYNADDYIFQIRENNFSGSIVYADTLESSDLSKGRVNLKEGTYGWGIQARNSISFTSFSSRIFEVDITAPSAPAILSNDTIQSGPFTLDWQHTVNDVDFDSLYIYGNANGTDLKKNVRANLTYTDSLSNGIYYWKVKSIDKAGNRGAFSTQKRLEIQ